jgi:hypothetical protein
MVLAEPGMETGCVGEFPDPVGIDLDGGHQEACPFAIMIVSSSSLSATGNQPAPSTEPSDQSLRWALGAISQIE